MSLVSKCFPVMCINEIPLPDKFALKYHRQIIYQHLCDVNNKLVHYGWLFKLGTLMFTARSLTIIAT